MNNAAVGNAAETAKNYTALMIKCAKDRELREKLLNPDNQEDIHNAIKDVGLVIPEDAHIVFDKDSAYSRAVLSDDKGEVFISEKTSSFEQIETVPRPQVKKGPLQDDMQATHVNIRGAAEDFKKLIVLPYYTISDVEIKFENDEKAEIVLSTC